METNRAPDTVRCAPDCPVRPTTEGKDGLPDLFSTADIHEKEIIIYYE